MDDPNPSPDRETQEYYLAVWRVALARLLGWPEDRILAWTSTTGQEYLQSSHLNHEYPAYYIVPHLIPRSLARVLPLRRYWELVSAVIRTLEITSELGMLHPEYDWAAARQRLDALLDEFGRELPR